MRPLGSTIGAMSRFNGLNLSSSSCPSFCSNFLACLRSSLNRLLMPPALGRDEEFRLAGELPMKLCSGVIANELILLAS